MAYNTVAELKDSISAQLQGLNLNNVKSLYTALERTARQVCIKLDIPEASLRQSVTLYDGVFDYAGLTNIFGQAVTDIRPQGVWRPQTAYAYRTPAEQFDREKQLGSTGFKIAFEYKNGTPITRIVSSIPQSRAVLDPQSSTDGWTASGSVSGLADDTVVYYDSPASLRFTLTGSSTGILTKTIASGDLSQYEDVGVAFMAIRIPDGATATNLTSIELRLGSSASAYDSVSDTDGFLGAWVAGEWLLVAFDFSGSTSTGMPDWTAIDYVQIRFAHTGTFTNFRVGGLWLSYPSPAEVLYQSNAIFLASGGTTPSHRITNDNDGVQLNESAYAIYEVECAKTIAKQQGGTLASGLVQTLNSDLNGQTGQDGLLGMYRADNPSREIREIGRYYD